MGELAENFRTCRNAGRSTGPADSRPSRCSGSFPWWKSSSARRANGATPATAACVHGTGEEDGGGGW